MGFLEPSPSYASALEALPKARGGSSVTSTMKTLRAVFTGLCLLPLAQVSFAGGTEAKAKDADACDNDAGYCYKFLDDLLNAPGVDSTAPMLRVRPTGLRDRLIRPRTQFVREMIKSVEIL